MCLKYRSLIRTSQYNGFLTEGAVPHRAKAASHTTFPPHADIPIPPFPFWSHIARVLGKHDDMYEVVVISQRIEDGYIAVAFFRGFVRGHLNEADPTRGARLLRHINLEFLAETMEVKRLCWMQRLALVRHSLHAASRSGDFTFFKTLQAQAFLDGTDHVAILSSVLGGETDTVLHTLDDLNAGLAYVHQDAFKNVYDNIRASIAEDEHSRRAKIRVDISQQKQIADFGIDKMANAAVALIESQEPACQDAVANVWLFGATIITDAIQNVLAQMDNLDTMMDDFILLEYSWQMVQTSVEASVSALRGVFNLMASSESGTNLIPHRTEPALSSLSAGSRTTSVSSATGSLLKRLSTVLHTAPVISAPPPSARNSVSFEGASPQHLRQSISQSFPMNVPMSRGEFQRRLSTIPPTPFEVNVNPFDTNFQNSQANSAYSVNDAMQEDPSPLDCDPLSTGDIAEQASPESKLFNQNPTFFRRLSRDMGPRAIAV